MSEPRHADRRVAAVIESSVLFGMLASVLDAVFRAASGSVVVRLLARAAAGWRRLDLPSQRQMAGTTVLVAVAVHLALMLMTAAPPGWLWLVLPGLASAIGLLLVAAPGLAGVTRR